ncbi:MAG: hypothetical protein Q8L51_02545, partial [Candidatus Amesbacteria bacterium]|nr:hypothetical protein [Candidatus Amesbacteria bacterium]
NPSLCFNAYDKTGHFCKQYDDIKLLFTDEDMTPHEVELFGVMFNTFPPEVQAGLYLIRGGSFKFKDLIKVSLLHQATGLEVPIKFRDFGSNIRKSYAMKHKIFELKELINYWSGGTGTIAKRALKSILPKSTRELGKKMAAKLLTRLY